MLHESEFRALCKEVASEFEGVTTENVMEMVKATFLCAENHIREGSLTPIYFKYLGRFVATKRSREDLKKRRDDISIKSELSSEGDPKAPPEGDGVRDILEDT